MKFARGNRALGECGRSGRKMLLKDMIHDGLYPHMLVDPDWYEPPYPPRTYVDVIDGIALRQPAPRRDQLNALIRFPLFDVMTGRRGAELFHCYATDVEIASSKFNVALYQSEPGGHYSEPGESVGDGYHAGGQPITAIQDIEDQTKFHDSVWPRVTVSAAWVLVYNRESLESLFSCCLGSLVRCKNGRLRIDWRNVTYIKRSHNPIIRID